MAMQDNEMLPGAAAGMNPQIQAFLNLLMGGGLHGFGGFGGQPFGGFGQFLMNNPTLMQGLGLIPHGAVPGPLPGSAPVVDSVTPVPGSQLGATDGATSPAAPTAPPSQITPPYGTPEAPTAPLGTSAGPGTPGTLPNILSSGFIRPGAAPDVGGMVGSMLAGGSPSQVAQNVLPMLRKG